MKWLGHDRAFQGAGHGIIENRKIPGVGGERKMLECTQQGKQQKPGKQEIAEKPILPVKKHAAVQKFFNRLSPGARIQTIDNRLWLVKLNGGRQSIVERSPLTNGFPGFVIL